MNLPHPGNARPIRLTILRFSIDYIVTFRNIREQDVNPTPILRNLEELHLLACWAARVR